MAESYLLNYQRLKMYLNNNSENSPEKWAKDYAEYKDSEYKDTQFHLEAVEEVRHNLLVYIKEYTPGKQESWTNSEALDALMTCVQFDKANALYFMKLNRYDPDCPRGIPWVTKENLAEIADIAWGDSVVRYSITRMYKIFANAHGASEEYKQKLDQELQTVLPLWLLKEQETCTECCG